MAGLPRPAIAVPVKRASMRPPITARPSSARSNSTAPPVSRHGAVSPAESVASRATTPSRPNKRKERDFEGLEETNINVVVRCRGRNEREVRENSGVVLSTEGTRGKHVDLSMGPSALSNKSYTFDKVFSPAADQAMIFDDVVAPLLDEMLAGYNCTIFAYGQTGTGKTYTMTGDMHDTLGIPSDAAGIIPRTLRALFTKLENDEAESSVKCSFIELYNEELRDLVSPDDTQKLKIYEDGKKGSTATMVQGMEECHIKTAIEGIKLLQSGSHKRQVAATKCNDLSSRSHTVFTITTYIKRQGDTGEDYVSAGKLNLVDLAGSENIQRSGAENKRAAEAGLINKSLLTLGRVINALVEKSSHIPYRESKLTRLLQDSLGGRTKTCIIATVSPAKSNLEETISTLDYAFRAKNIRNKPQVNQMINKKTLLKEFTMEIEKLKGELIATRQRNGVYLTNENYEEITGESESRRILSEEQAAKIETMEANLRNKVQDLFAMTTNFMKLKKDHDGTITVLDDTKSVLDQTEFVLKTTKQAFAEETMLRMAHAETEERLDEIGSELISTIGRTISDVEGLHSKLRRTSDLRSVNQNAWGLSQQQVTSVTTLVERRIAEFRTHQETAMADVSSRMQSFVSAELSHLTSTKEFLEKNVQIFEASEKEVLQQTDQAKEEMDCVLEEIKILREDVKTRVGEGLQGLSAAAARISEEVISELGVFHTQLHGSYSSLGKDFKTMFEELLRHINAQKEEAIALRQQLHVATEAAMQASITAYAQLDMVLAEERKQGGADREDLLRQITSLITQQGDVQDARMSSKINQIQQDVKASTSTFNVSRLQYAQGMDAWNDKEGGLVENVLKSRELLKCKLKDDWMTANKHNASLQSATKSVHEETVRIVDKQMQQIETQMHALDDFVTRARSQNGTHHDQHVKSLDGLSSTVRTSYDSIGDHFVASCERVRDIGNSIAVQTKTLCETLSPLDTTLRQPLAELRANIVNTQFMEYVSTGETPQKITYTYPVELPRTATHESLLDTFRGVTKPQPLGISSPSKSNTIVFQDPVLDVEASFNEEVITARHSSTHSHSLNQDLSERTPTGPYRDMQHNHSGFNGGIQNSMERPTSAEGPPPLPVAITVATSMAMSSGVGNAGSGMVSLANGIMNAKDENIVPPGAFKRSVSGLKVPSRIGGVKKSVIPLEGRENERPVGFVQGAGRRRSPRMAEQ